MLTDAERVHLIQEALTATVMLDSHRAAEVMTRIGQNSEPHQMYATCCAFASTAQRALEGVSGRKVGVGGSMVVLEDLKPDEAHDPADMFAARFAAAYMNGDTDTTSALFNASLDASVDEHVDSILSLMVLAAHWSRVYIEHKKQEEAILQALADGSKDES